MGNHAEQITRSRTRITIGLILRARRAPRCCARILRYGLGVVLRKASRRRRSLQSLRRPEDPQAVPSLQRLMAAGQRCAALFAAAPTTDPASAAGSRVQDLVVWIAAADHVRQVRLDALVCQVAVPLRRDLAVQRTQRLVAAHQHRLGLLLGRMGGFVARTCKAVVLVRFRLATSFSGEE